MSDRPPIDDPFAGGDPAAEERARRRAERDAKRRQRSDRQSLGDRVVGALDGAAAKGRDVVEQGRERIAESRDDDRGAEPPPFRRERAAPTEPAPAQRQEPPSGELVREPARRLSAEELMPPRPTRAPEAPAAQPEREPGPEPDREPEPVASRPPEEPPPPRPVTPALGATPPPGTPSSHAAGRRRLAIAAVLLLGIVGIGVSLIYASTRNEEPPPVVEGPRTLKTDSVTIPEGLTRVEMAQVAKDAGLEGDYEKETAAPPKGFAARELGLPGGAPLEGFLFPATYEVERGAKASDLVEKQLVAFNENLDQVDLREAQKKNLTPYDVVTIASMIEREVQVPKERPLVAAVIYNRLADGEPLGIDATLRYEVGFDEPLTESELESDSPYNTRISPGLPPTPIGNPGLDSITAAANPANVGFKYYVIEPGTCGEHFFTDDFDEFLAASDEYNAALEAEGGSPTEC